MKKHILLGLFIVVHITFANGQKQWHLDQTLEIKRDSLRIEHVVANGEYMFIADQSKILKDQGTGESLAGAGAIYIYKLQSSGEYELTQRLFPPKPAANIKFGVYMGVSDDYIAVVSVVGIYIYHLEKGKWRYSHTIDYPEESIQFPEIKLYGDYLLFGNPIAQLDENQENPIGLAGSVEVYKLENGRFKRKTTLVSPDRDKFSQFGFRVEFDGNLLLILALERDEPNGSIFNYELVDGEFESIYTLTDNRVFLYGQDMKMSNEVLLVQSGQVGINEVDVQSYTYSHDFKRWRPQNQVDRPYPAIRRMLLNKRFAFIEQSFYSPDLEERYNFDLGESGLNPYTLTETDRLITETIDSNSDYKIDIYRWGYPLSISGAIQQPVELYPNPANDRLNLQHRGGQHYSIYRSDGKLMLSADYSNEIQIDIPTDWQGVYMLRSTDLKGGTMVSTFIVE